MVHVGYSATLQVSLNDSAPWRLRPLSASSSQPRKRNHRTAWLTKRVLALGDADRSHLRAFGCDQIAVTASICESSAAFFRLHMAHQAQLIVGAFRKDGRLASVSLR
jgi:hypothetical protein